MRVLLDIEEMYHDHALTLLRWLAYARSPPTLSELVDAAVTDPIHESYIDADNRGDLEDTLNILSGLVTVEEREDADAEHHSEIDYSTSDVSIIDNDSADVGSHSRDLTPDTRVRLAHFSVKEYLESKRILKSGADQFYLESATGHRALAQSCLTYLRYYSSSSEKTSTKQDLKKFPLLQYAARSWSHHSAFQVDNDVTREASLLQSEEAKNDWLLVYNPDELWKSPFESSGSVGSGLYYASGLGHEALVRELLRNGSDVNVPGGRFGNALQAASIEGWVNVVRLLVENGVDVNADGGEYGNALHAASEKGHVKVMRLLLDSGANMGVQNGRFGDALQLAALEGHIEGVRLLLDRDADVNDLGGDDGDALQAASRGGHIAVVQLLLENGADFSTTGGEYGNALQAASFEGHTEVVRLLLEKGANPLAVGGQ
jgi:hypothetical protein